MTSREFEIGSKIVQMNAHNLENAATMLKQLGFTDEQIKELLGVDDEFKLGRIINNKYYYVTVDYKVGEKVFAKDTFDWYLGEDINVYATAEEAEMAAAEMRKKTKAKSYLMSDDEAFAWMLSHLVLGSKS